ncbi:MAG: J domain-containing protein [Methanocorpusculum sp.]|nr:J domain-containing protein [Methanocorpusculum sp.]
MKEQMTKERAYEILGIPFGSDFPTTSKAFHDIREKYHPDVNPYMREEYVKALSAFEFLQNLF